MKEVDKSPEIGVADKLSLAAAKARLAAMPKHDLTVADGVKRVREAYKGKPIYRNMKPHLALIREALGETLLTEVDALDLEILRDVAMEAARERNRGKHGVGAGEHFNDAARALFRVSERSLSGYNPAVTMQPLKRPDSTRTALSPDAVQVLFVCVLAVTDPVLAHLIGQFTLQSGARLMGLVNLRLKDLRDAPYVLLEEKNRSRRRVPITDALRRALLEFALSRGAASWEDHVFRSSQHKPVSDSYVGELMRQWRWQCRVQGYTQIDDEFSHHWLRHTAVNNYAHVAGLTLASHYAGHKITRLFGVTGTYTHVGDAQLIPVCERLHGPTRDSGHDWYQHMTTTEEGRLALKSSQTEWMEIPVHGLPEGR